jgi:hypothetical protein
MAEISMRDDFARDLSHGARLLRRNPAFSIVVVATLAVAIGAAVAVFSVVDAWLFRPLNFPDAERLAIAFAARPERPNEPAVWLPYRAFLGWKERSRSLCGLMPALRASAADPYDALRSGGERGPAVAPAHRAQVMMLVGQMAGCVVMLVATTLLMRTFMRLHAEPLGFEARNVSVANLILPNDPFDSSEKRNIFYPGRRPDSDHCRGPFRRSG